MDTFLTEFNMYLSLFCIINGLIIMLMLQSSDEELEQFEVNLHKSSGRGIGIVIAGLADADTGSKI